ncbi:hypothetical protein SAY87_029145 [Trapa incisa]|uniref:Uncharacterized protein n=1 Tax=Trapa incisa TaxID=236973 RepID=A0AAN7L3R4_9MYRT|nr:hypothetical protein SAY87_029145 [Trapa incisa]
MPYAYEAYAAVRLLMSHGCGWSLLVIVRGNRMLNGVLCLWRNWEMEKKSFYFLLLIIPSPAHCSNISSQHPLLACLLADINNLSLHYYSSPSFSSMVFFSYISLLPNFSPSGVFLCESRNLTIQSCLNAPKALKISPLHQRLDLVRIPFISMPSNQIGATRQNR